MALGLLSIAILSSFTFVNQVRLAQAFIQNKAPCTPKRIEENDAKIAY